MSDPAAWRGLRGLPVPTLKNISRRWRSRISVSALALIAGGCAVHQRDEVAIYRKVIDGNKPAHIHILPGQVVTLTDALHMAIQNEEQLSVQGETYLQALITKELTVAEFFPTISVSPGYNISNNSTNAFGTYAHNFNFPIGGVEGSLNPYSQIHAFRQAQQTAAQDKQLIFDLGQTILLNVAQAYYNVLTNEQSVEVLGNSLKVQQANVNLMEEEEKVGTARPLDVAQAQSEASATQVSLLQAQANVRLYRSTLAYLVDAPIEANPLRDDFEPPTNIPPMRVWILRGFALRQDLKADNAAVRAAREAVEVAYGQYLPSIQLSLDYMLYDEALPGSGDVAGAISLAQPLYNFGVTQANVRAAWSQFRVAALNEAQLRRTVYEGVEQAYINLDSAHSQLAELEVEVRAARYALYLADAEYRSGNGTYLNVLTAQNTLLNTQLQLTEEVFTQKTAYFNLLRSVGQLGYSTVVSTTRPTHQRLKNLATQPVVAPREPGAAIQPGAPMPPALEHNVPSSQSTVPATLPAPSAIPGLAPTTEPSATEPDIH